MTWEEKLAALQAEGAKLRKKLVETPDRYTDEDGERAEEILKGVTEAKGKIASLARMGEALDTITAGAKATPARGGLKSVPGPEAHFTAAFGRAMRDQAPRGMATKALVPGATPVTVTDFNEPFAYDPRGGFSLENVVGRDETHDPSGSYLRQTKRENAATSVAAGAAKPTSVYETVVKSWRLATIAHLSQPFPKQWLSDYKQLEEFLGAELSFGLDTAVNQYILHGGVDEDGKPVVGVLDDPDIPKTAFTRDALLSLRAAIGELDVIGSASTGIVLHPDDWQAIETLKDSEGRFILPLTPNQEAIRALWGLPVTLDAGMTPGKGLVGNLQTMGLLTGDLIMVSGREVAPGSKSTYTPSVKPTSQIFEAGSVNGSDLIGTNQCVVRAEARVALLIPQPKTLRVVDLAA